MARPERFELPTTWFVARYSIQLSYGRFEGPGIIPEQGSTVKKRGPKARKNRLLGAAYSCVRQPTWPSCWVRLRKSARVHKGFRLGQTLANGIKVLIAFCLMAVSNTA